MKIYIANCSEQDHVFTYMLPENLRPFSHNIRAGAQIEITGSPDEIDCIIRQHEIYGFHEVSKVKKGFGGRTYRFDKPISIEAIEQGISQTTQEQINRALEARKVTAVVADQYISDSARQMGIKQTASVEIEITEEKKNIADHDKKFSETIGVSREGVEPKRRGRPAKAH